MFALVLGFGAVGVLSNIIEGRLGLEVGSPGMVAYDVALAILLTLVGAIVLWVVWRPVDSRLRFQEVALERAVGQLEGIIAAAPVGIVTVDLDGVVTGAWNRAAEKITGWGREEGVGRTLPWRVADRGLALDDLRRRLVAGESVMGLHDTWTRKDGSLVEVSLHAALLRDQAEQPDGILLIFADITQRLRDHRALVFHSSVLDRLVDPVIAYNARFEVTYWNPAAERLYGWTGAEMMGSYANARLDLRPVGTTLDAVRQALREQGEHRGEFLQRCKDGSAVHVEAHCTALRDDRGTVTGYVTTNRNLTERREMEAALRESEARFRRLIENAPDIVYRYRVRPTRVLEYASPALAEVSGYSLAEFYQDPDMPRRLLQPEHQAIIDTLGQRPEELDGQSVVLPWRRKDGSTVWVEQRNILVRDAAGAVVAIEGIARDITRRKALEDGYARKSAVVEQAAELVLITELDGTISYVNPAFERVTGYRAEEVLGLTPRILKSGHQSEELYAELWAALRRGESWSGRFRNRRKDGTLYLADVVLSPVRDSNQEVVNYVGLQRDVTRESELDEQLRQAQKMEAVGQLTGGIAHDFNNLLTVILANIALVQEVTAGVEGEVPRYLRDIQGAAHRGAEMVRKLLAFGRQERLLPRPANLRHLVAEFLQTVGRILPATIEMHASGRDDLPAAIVDPGALEQILLNLATNSRDAMPSGGAIEVRLGIAEFDRVGERSVSGWCEPGRFVHLGFRDTGTGMSAEHLERIFEPFFTTKATGKGSGLGMPMVYGLMKQHHGFVTVESSPGHGTTVHLYFPATDGGAIDRERREEQETLPRGTETIMLVEDEEPIRRVATLILQRLGYTVITARDGMDALELLQGVATQVDLLISDVVMPRLNGPDLVARLRESGSTVRVLFATGYASSDLLNQGSVPSGALFIEKPWSVDLLARRVREALAGRD